jgi:hypothetical protein
VTPETFRAHRRVGRAESRRVQAVGQQTRQGEQPGENGVTLGEKGSARGRAARPRTLGDFLPGGRFVGHRQRDPVDQPGVERRVSPPSHGPVLTEASLGPLPVEEVGLAGRVSDRAMRHFPQKRRRAQRLDGDLGRGATMSAQRWSSLSESWRHLLGTRRPRVANHLQHLTAETTTSRVWWSGSRSLSTTSWILVLSPCAALSEARCTLQ